MIFIHRSSGQKKGGFRFYDGSEGVDCVSTFALVTSFGWSSGSDTGFRRYFF